jgi:hypothetical protein
VDISDIIAVFAASMCLPVAVIVGILANRRGRFGYGWFLASVVATPVVTGPLLLVLPRQSRVAAAPPNVEPQTPNNDLGITASPKLRLIFVVVAGAMLVLWGLSLVPPIENWDNPNEDGFSYVPAFWATIICLPVAVYLVAGAFARGARYIARARSALFIGGGTLFIVVAFLIFQHIANSMGDLGLS